jgi:hypothetical protein
MKAADKCGAHVPIHILLVLIVWYYRIECKGKYQSCDPQDCVGIYGEGGATGEGQTNDGSQRHLPSKDLLPAPATRKEEA